MTNLVDEKRTFLYLALCTPAAPLKLPILAQHDMSDRLRHTITHQTEVAQLNRAQALAQRMLAERRTDFSHVQRREE